MFTQEELEILAQALMFAMDMDGDFDERDVRELLEKVESLRVITAIEGIGYQPRRPVDLWVTVALFDGRVAHTEEMWIKAHSEEGLAWDEARKNINGARESGYSGTGTAIFAVEVDSGQPAMMSVLVGDKQ